MTGWTGSGDRSAPAPLTWTGKPGGARPGAGAGARADAGTRPDQGLEDTLIPTAETAAVAGAGLGDVLSRIVAGARQETTAGLSAVGWREDEIAQAIGRHPRAENDLFHANRIVLPCIISAAWDCEFVFRGHVRELLERVAAGQDTRPGTAAECCIAMAAVNMAIPLHGAAAGFYFRMWRQAFPGHLVCGQELSSHYEAVHGHGMDTHEQYVRRKLSVRGRRLDAARIECDGEHWGLTVTCQYATHAQDEE